MEKPLISVIIPCYNVDAYIGRCLNSLFADPMFERLEIVCVDDGSSDRTLDVLQDYSSRHANIIISSQNNSGQSAARNTGVAMARGDYVGYVDSDDWVSPGFFSALHARAMETGADVIFCNIETVHDHGRTDPLNARPYPIDQFSMLALSNEASKAELISVFLKDKISVSPCNKLIRKSLLEKNQIKYTTGYFNEDMEYALDLLLHASSLAKTEAATYYYWQRSGSTTKRADLRVLDMLTIVNRISDKVRNRFPDRFDALLESYMLLNSIYVTTCRIKGASSEVVLSVVPKLSAEMKRVRYSFIFRLEQTSAKRKLLYCLVKMCPFLACKLIGA